jgi:hypothetical protein
MTARPPLYWLTWFGAALLTLTAFALLLDLPAIAGEVRRLRMAVLVGLLVLSAAVYPAAARVVLCHAWPRWLISAIGA